MARKTTAIDQAMTYREILKHLPEDKFIELEDLKLMLELDGIVLNEQALRRYLDDLSNNYELTSVCCNKKDHAHSWKRDPVNRRPALTAPTLEECALLRLAEENMKSYLPVDLQEQLSQLFHRTRELLGEKEPGTAKGRLLRSIGGKTIRGDRSLDPTLFNTLSQAVVEGYWIEMGIVLKRGTRIYEKYNGMNDDDGIAKAFRFLPLRLVYGARHEWYLMG